MERTSTSEFYSIFHHPAFFGSIRFQSLLPFFLCGSAGLVVSALLPNTRVSFVRPLSGLVRVAIHDRFGSEFYYLIIQKFPVAFFFLCLIFYDLKLILLYSFKNKKIKKSRRMKRRKYPLPSPKKKHSQRKIIRKRMKGQKNPNQMREKALKKMKLMLKQRKLRG